MNKKAILITVGVLSLFLCICITVFGLIFVSIMSKVQEEAKVIKSEVLDEVCTSHGDFTKDEYNQWFTPGFRDKNSHKDSQALITEVFPNSYDCNSLISGNLIQIIKRKQGIEVNWRSGIKTANVSYYLDDNKYISLYLISDGNNWKIQGINTTKIVY